MAFSFNARLPDYDDWGVQTFVKPRPGFYCFLSGLILSMLLSRIAIHYHYHAESFVPRQQPHHPDDGDDDQSRGRSSSSSWRSRRKTSLTTNDDDGDGESSYADLNRHASLKSEGEEGARSSSSNRRGHDEDAGTRSLFGVQSIIWKDVLICTFLLGLVGFFILGVVSHAFRFHFTGLAGWALVSDIKTSFPSLHTYSHIPSLSCTYVL